MNELSTQTWYQTLIKPDWAPPASYFGPIWMVLYITIIIALIMVLKNTFTKKGKAWPKFILYTFIVNIIANVIFTPIQFGLQNLFLACADIIVILITCFALVISIYPYSKKASLLLVPYTLWVTIATVLQISIFVLN